MCNSVWAVDDRKMIRNCGEFSEWLGCKLTELVPEDYGGDAEAAEPADARDCLCQIDIPATLDNFKIWHRRDVDGDSMRYFAMKHSAA